MVSLYAKSLTDLPVG